MLQYVFAGLALGSIYAIASASLTVTFISAGVLNFAFGSMAYFVARSYYWLNSQHGWSSGTAGIVCILGIGPALGVVLYSGLFRFVRGKSQLIKLVTTIGVSVSLPPVADFVFGTATPTSVPGLAPMLGKPVHVLGSPITPDQLITYGFLLFVLLFGTFVLRVTNVGLRIRAMVDSEALASLSGTNPGAVALGVWACTASLTGLAGILVAPTNGLSTSGMTTLMAAAFAAVVACRLRSLAGAVVISLAMGVVTDVIQKYLPANSSFTGAVIPSIPFVFIVVFLLFYLARSGSLNEGAGVLGPLDAAIRPAGQETEDLTSADAQLSTRRAAFLSVVPILVVVALPFIFRGSAYWLSLVAIGLCYGMTFLTFTIVTGEGGMLWLCQIIFAGVGALTTAQLATNAHLPVLLAVFCGGLVSAAAGAVIGLLTIRLGDLYVALVTLTFGLLMEQLVFTRPRFLEGGLGVAVPRPSFAESDLAFAYLALAVIVIFATFTLNLRRSTSGMALRAVRDSAPASRTIGLSVLQVKVLVGAIAAFVAAVGGGFLAMDSFLALPQNYETFGGLVWLAVVAALGTRSISAAVLAGVAYSVMPGVFQVYVPVRWAEVPTMLFGIGAIAVATHPEGAVAQNGKMIRALILRLWPAAGAGGPGNPTGGGASGPPLEPEDMSPPRVNWPDARIASGLQDEHPPTSSLTLTLDVKVIGLPALGAQGEAP
jgi:branched-chain amino acid transport system permease protein